MKKAIIIIFSIAFFVIVVLAYMFYSIPDMEPVYKSKRLFFPKTNSELFLKSKVWGMTYDSKVIVLSEDGQDKVIADPKNEYIFKGVSYLFYKLKHDTLLIYTPSRTATPTLLNSKIIIEQVELDNVTMIGLFKDKEYLQQGLTIFE